MKTTPIRDMLYEEPGPKTRRTVAIVTILAVFLLLALLAVVIRQFVITGQFAPRYWDFFTRWTTWRFLGEGLITTTEAALTGSAIAFVLGFLLMRGKIRKTGWSMPFPSD